MDLRDCQEVASATHLQPFESHLVRFGNELGFGLLPADYMSTSASVERGKRDPVMRRLKRLRVPFAYDQSMYVEEAAADIWDVQAQYGFKTGIAMTLNLGPGKYLIIGVDRDDPLPDDSSRLHAYLPTCICSLPMYKWRLCVFSHPSIASMNCHTSVR